MYGIEWTNANYPKETFDPNYVITSMRFIEKIGTYNLFETDSGTLVNVFGNHPNVLAVLKDNPDDLFAVGFLSEKSKYQSYTLNLSSKGLIRVSTVARVMPIMKGTREHPRAMILFGDPALPMGL